MTRISVVTGAASGIGAATRKLLEARGEKVIGVDLRGMDIAADLTTDDGRAAAVERVAELSGGRIDAVYVVAGSAAPAPSTIALNFFGATAILDGLRPLLAGSAAPRAVAVSSFAAIHAGDGALLGALRDDDEKAAMDRAAELAENPLQRNLIYPTSKKALSQWVRRHAPSESWAGAGIALNAVAPGTTVTPMTAPFLETPEGTAALMEITPMPLNGISGPDVIAKAMAWLGGEENTHLCGQVIFVDGGSEAILRGDSAW